MSNIQDQIRQDAASLHRFICSISDKCERLSAAVTYPASSERFFKYISELAAETKAYLQESLDGPTKSPLQCLDFRDEIATLRSSWSFMHQFVKPVLDADTLRLPTCFLDGLKARFRQLPNCEDTDFVFYHTSYLNYFNIKLEKFKARAHQISNFVAGRSEFPEHLGLIGIPYSQSSSLFVNCLIAHEMGHYLFGELKMANRFRKDIENRLIGLYGTDLDTDQRTRLTDVMLMWIEELFCDVFAVRLIGFCFSLAFVELFDSAAVLDESGDCQKLKGERAFLLHQHPPELFRLKLQVSILKSDGWWTRIVKDTSTGGDTNTGLEMTDSHYVRALKVIGDLKDEDFFFPDYPPPLLPSTKVSVDIKSLFFGILPNMIADLDVATGTVRDGADIWASHGDLIERYLENGTVPSTLVQTAGSTPAHPKPVALFNASYRFYIQSLPKLTSTIENFKQEQIVDSSYWASKVESWTAKAIEDVALLEGKNCPLVGQGLAQGAEVDDGEETGTVLSATSLRRRMKLPVWDRDSLVITPLLDADSFDQDSIDLRLGTHFLMPQVPPEPYTDIAGNERRSHTYLQLHAPLGGYFVLPAHQTVLGATLEFVKLPFDVSGEILTKSSVARTFIMIETAPWIHPSYRGCLTLEIANVSNTAIILYPGTPIGQLVLFQAGLKEPPKKLSGSYLGPIYPEAPNMKAPREVLEKLGLSRYRRPGHGWIDGSKLRAEVLDAMGRMSPSELLKVRTVIDILHKNGGLPADSDVVEFIRGSAQDGV